MGDHHDQYDESPSPKSGKCSYLYCTEKPQHVTWVGDELVQVCNIHMMSVYANQEHLR